VGIHGDQIPTVPDDDHVAVAVHLIAGVNHIARRCGVHRACRWARPCRCLHAPCPSACQKERTAGARRRASAKAPMSSAQAMPRPARTSRWIQDWSRAARPTCPSTNTGCPGARTSFLCIPLISRRSSMGCLLAWRSSPGFRPARPCASAREIVRVQRLVRAAGRAAERRQHAKQGDCESPPGDHALPLPCPAAGVYWRLMRSLGHQVASLASVGRWVRSRPMGVTETWPC